MRSWIRTNTLQIWNNIHKGELRRFFIDIHCRCLPAFNDGHATLHKSMALCETLVSDGVGIVVATPYFLRSFGCRADAVNVRTKDEDMSAYSAAI